MSKIEDKQLEKTEEERRFWKDARTMNVFNLFVQGKDINFISDTLSMRPLTVESLITKRYFIKKLESHIRGVLFTNQVAKVIAASDVFSKLWERVTDNINEIPPEICLKELTKMFPTKKEGMIINPKNMNVFMNVMKGKDPADVGDAVMDMSDDLGFDGLDDDSDAYYPELGEGEPNDIKQGNNPMDSKEPNKDQ